MSTICKYWSEYDPRVLGWVQPESGLVRMIVTSYLLLWSPSKKSLVKSKLRGRFRMRRKPWQPWRDSSRTDYVVSQHPIWTQWSYHQVGLGKAPRLRSRSNVTRGGHVLCRTREDSARPASPRWTRHYVNYRSISRSCISAAVSVSAILFAAQQGHAGLSHLTALNKAISTGLWTAKLLIVSQVDNEV